MWREVGCDLPWKPNGKDVKRSQLRYMLQTKEDLERNQIRVALETYYDIDLEWNLIQIQSEKICPITQLKCRVKSNKIYRETK